MRAAIDGTPLTLSSGGLARYTTGIAVALAEEFPEDEYLLLSDQPFSLPPRAPSNLRKASGPLTRNERRWWLWGASQAIRRERVQVFHGTNFAVPYLKRSPSVLSLHDLSPWMDIAWHHAADRTRRRTPWLIKLRIATMILTLSEAVRKQAIERFRIDPSRILAVPLAASPDFHPVEPVPAKPYFLYVGTLEPRKNLHQLLDAWRAVKQVHDIDLVLAGRRREDFPELPPEPGVRLLGEVPDADLPALYSGALAFVYPSHYEGFGLPVLEAMQCGAFVIASNDPAIGEVTAGAAVRTGSVKELIDALTNAVEQPEWVAEHREKSLRRARDFSWPRTARLTREVYTAAIERFGRA
ncbi:MAG: glycosyltransferase family 4 protein [Acidobacteriota bacterium]|nr:glycosyltransferase family 4 protein [Acidobacteriota bacterium]